VGCYNLHPGPLPGYAGLHAPNWALYHGETTHAVTLHWMAPGIDTGAVAYESSFPVSPDDTGFSLSAACVRRGLELVSRLLTALATDVTTVPVIEQDSTGRRYFGRGIPHDGWIPWSEDATRVTGLVRACDYGPWASPWGRPRTRGVDGLEITVRRAQRTGVLATEPPGTVGSCDVDQAWVATRDEWVAISRLQVDNSPSPVDLVMSPGDVLGVPTRRCTEPESTGRSRCSGGRDLR
ncbi:MAG: methionyl-tRNA formyltransferase, partial [Pseudonocardia sp.]